MDGYLARLPADWRARVSPLVFVDPECLQDGRLVEAWAPSTVLRRLGALAVHVDFCRARNLPLDVAPASVRCDLQHWHRRAASGKVRIAGAAIHIQSLLGLATMVWPERDWRWLATTKDRLKKLALHHPALNAGRAVDAAELRVAGLELFVAAEREFDRARKWREFQKAHTRARTALTMILLTEAPLRIGSCAALDLTRNLLDDLAGLRLDAHETKERQADVRQFSRDLVRALRSYIARHRAVIAAPGETRLFVGTHGGPVHGQVLSQSMGDATEPTFKRRVTAHAVRHSVANYIVAEAPDEAALAATILNHHDLRVTEGYVVRAGQIAASRRLGDAHRVAAAALGADPGRALPGTGSGGAPKRRRRLPRVPQSRTTRPATRRASG